MAIANMNFKIFCVLIYILLILKIAFTQTSEWKLVWDMNSELDMKEYIVYRFSSGNHESPIATVPHNVDTEFSERNLVDSTITFFDKTLEEGQKYYYRIQAVDSTNLRSDFSGTVSDFIPGLDHDNHLHVIEAGLSTYSFDLDDYLIFPENPDSILWHIFENDQIVENLTIGNFTVRVDTISGQSHVIPADRNLSSSEIFTFGAFNKRGFYDTCRVAFVVDYAPTITTKRSYPNIIDTLIILDSESIVVPNAAWHNFVQDNDNEKENLEYIILNGKYVDATKNDDPSYTLKQLNSFEKDTLTLIVSDHFLSDTANFIVESRTTNLNEKTNLSKPEHYYLLQNSPNPFNPGTVINFGLPQAGWVRIDLMNILGQKVATILDGHKNAGNHTVNFYAETLPSGYYFYAINSGKFYQTKKMILLK